MDYTAGTRQAASATRASEEDFRSKLTRRHIYLNRLVGDNALTPKKATIEPTASGAVFRFLFYLGLASLVIMTRNSVQTIFQMNNAMNTALTQVPFVDSTTNNLRYFEEIETMMHIKDWMEEVLIQDIQGTEQSRDFRRKFTIFGFNRVVPFPGLCADRAAVTLTLRRMSGARVSSWTTTDRFKALYPSVWLHSSMPAGVGTMEFEEKTNLTGTQTTSGVTPTWVYTPPPLGYGSQGGYVAVIGVGDLPEDSSTAAANNFVYLLSTDAPSVTDEAKGICTGLKRTSAITFEEFLDQPFLWEHFGSMTLEFTAYNANLQTMTKATIIFESSFAGRISTRVARYATARLDPYHASMRYFELAYLIFTVGYLLEFFYTLLKLRRAAVEMLKDGWVWIRFCSMIASLVSLIVWYVYTPFLANFNQTTDFMHPNSVEDFAGWILLYSRCSAIAALTIFLRSLEFLAQSKPRVMLLLRTVKMGTSHVVIYLIYIFAVFCGFVAFAQNYFAAYSSNFVTVPKSFLSCFYLFFGQNSAMTTVDGNAAVLKVTFYVLFIICFYFFSVQMFNAIINYAYNRVSEEMEPQLEAERRSRKKDAFQVWCHRRAGNDSHAGEGARGSQAGENSKNGGKDGHSGGAAAGARAVQAPGLSAEMAETLDEFERGRVDAFLNMDARKKVPESGRQIFGFMVFAACYLWFLAANLSINDSYQVRSAVVSALHKASGGHEEWDAVATLPNALEWMEVSFPTLVFNSTPPAAKARAVAKGVMRNETLCISSWNCFVTGEESGYTGAKALRITQRRSKYYDNEGRIHDDTPNDARFRGGTDPQSGLDYSKSLVPKRTQDSVIDPDSDPDDRENTSIALSAALSEFCIVSSPGDGKSYGDHGGLVCLLDVDEVSFRKQLGLLQTEKFFVPETSLLVVEFTLQNSNRQMLAYTRLEFVLLPSGALEKSLSVRSLLLFGLSDILDNFGNLVLRFLPGLIYLTFTVRFIYALYEGLRREWVRSAHKEGDRVLLTLFTFFRMDIFNSLEAVSISLSLASAVLFIIWCVENANLDERKAGDFCAFLNYSEGLTQKVTDYNRLSAINILLIGMRPFKFVRQNQRIAKMNQTLWAASQDILWFVLLLFLTMCGFATLTYLSFGRRVEEYSSLSSALVSCFQYLLGEFDLDALIEADALMSCFMFPYLIAMYCFFSNIFFAIIDRHFLPIEAIPFQWKRKLKPLLAKVCRCIEWDEDFVMEQDPNATKAVGPPSRKDRVKDVQTKIREEFRRAGMQDPTKPTVARAKDLSEVCEVDDRIEEALRWSRVEARRLRKLFKELQQEKRQDQSDEYFVMNRVMTEIDKEVSLSKAEKEEARRFMRYATQLYEQFALQDQETLARYIILLERTINRNNVEREQLQEEVTRMKDDMEKLNKDDIHSQVAATSPSAASPAVLTAAAHTSVAAHAARGDEAGAEADSGSSSSSDSDDGEGRHRKGVETRLEAAMKEYTNDTRGTEDQEEPDPSDPNATSSHMLHSTQALLDALNSARRKSVRG